MRKADRRAFFLSRVKRGAAAGSDYRAQMLAPRAPLPMKLGDLLSDLQCAIVGGAATRTYQPERYTNSIDVLVATTDVPAVRARLRDGGGHQGTSLAIPDSALGIEGDV